MTCPKCKSEKEPILCTFAADGFADVDTEDEDKDLAGTCVEVDTGFSLWLHVCRDCNYIQESGVNDWGCIANKSVQPTYGG